MATEPQSQPLTVSAEEASDPITEKVLRIIATQKRLPPEQVHLDSSFEQLGLDSLDAVYILFELESAFDISISDERARAIRSVQEMVAGVKQLIAQKAGSQ